MKSVLREAVPYLVLLAAAWLVALPPAAADLGFRLPDWLSGGLPVDFSLLDSTAHDRGFVTGFTSRAGVFAFPAALDASPSGLWQLVENIPWRGGILGASASLVEVALSGVFTFALVRALGAGRFGALVAGLSFALGGFAMTRALTGEVAGLVVWLPAVLLFGHASLCSQGRRRLLNVAYGGAIFGLATLDTAPEQLLVLAPLNWAFLVFCWLFGPIVVQHPPGTRDEPPLTWDRSGVRRAATAVKLAVYRVTAIQVRRTAVVVGAAVGIPAIGLALGAMRLLAESGSESITPAHGQAGGQTPILPLISFIQLVLPFFLQGPAGEGPTGAGWFGWMTPRTLPYLGVLPLCLAAAAPFVALRRPTYFSLGLTALGIALLSGAYQALWPVSALRAPDGMGLPDPGVFPLLAALGFSLLAGLGADAVDRALRAAPKRSLLPAVAVLVPFLASFALVTAITLSRRWAEVAWPATLDLIRIQQQAMSGQSGPMPSPLEVFVGLQNSLDPLSPPTVWAVGLLLSSGLLLLGWRQFRRLRVAWYGALLGLVALDLIVFAQNGHRVEEIRAARDQPAAMLSGVVQAGPTLAPSAGFVRSGGTPGSSRLASIRGYPSTPFERSPSHRRLSWPDAFIPPLAFVVTLGTGLTLLAFWLIPPVRRWSDAATEWLRSRDRSTDTLSRCSPRHSGTASPPASRPPPLHRMERGTGGEVVSSVRRRGGRGVRPAAPTKPAP